MICFIVRYNYFDLFQISVSDLSFNEKKTLSLILGTKSPPLLDYLMTLELEKKEKRIHKKKFSFSPWLHLHLSHSLPISDRKNTGRSIQKAFSPFLSWPVNPFINCSGL